MKDLDDKLVGLFCLTLLGLAYMVLGSLGKNPPTEVVMAIVTGIAGLITGRKER